MLDHLDIITNHGSLDIRGGQVFLVPGGRASCLVGSNIRCSPYMIILSPLKAIHLKAIHHLYMVHLKTFIGMAKPRKRYTHIYFLSFKYLSTSSSSCFVSRSREGPNNGVSGADRADGIAPIILPPAME